MDDANKEISSLKLTIDDGSCVTDFGSKADEICMSAVERFSTEAPLPDDDKSNESLYDKKNDFGCLEIINYLDKNNRKEI